MIGKKNIFIGLSLTCLLIAPISGKLLYLGSANGTQKYLLLTIHAGSAEDDPSK